jgi:hypothetical protein
MRCLLFFLVATAAYDAGMIPYAQGRRLRSTFGMKEGRTESLVTADETSHEASPDPPPSQHPHYFAWCVAVTAAIAAITMIRLFGGKRQKTGQGLTDISNVLVDGPFAAEMELIHVAKNAPPFGSDVESVDMMDLHCPVGDIYLQTLQNGLSPANVEKLKGIARDVPKATSGVSSGKHPKLSVNSIAVDPEVGAAQVIALVALHCGIGMGQAKKFMVQEGHAQDPNKGSGFVLHMDSSSKYTPGTHPHHLQACSSHHHQHAKS